MAAMSGAIVMSKIQQLNRGFQPLIDAPELR